jgi:nicotinamide riboside transporter PnuC
MLWSYTLAGLGVISLYLTGKKLKIGWVVGIVNSGLWIAYGLITEQYGFIASAVVFITVQARNYHSWHKEESNSNASL